jgi:quinol monooxygenase YgiN
MAYTVIRRYTVEPADADEAVRRAAAGFVPLIRKAPGFVAYRMVKADDGTLITTSTFETRAQGEESVRMAAGWVRENLGALLPNPPTVVGGEVRVRHVAAGVEPAYGVMRHYPKVTDLAEAERRVEAGLVPILRKLPGFASYLVVDPGDGSVVSLSSFRDRAQVQQSSQEARDWVQQNLADLLPEPPQVTTGEIVGGATA